MVFKIRNILAICIMLCSLGPVYGQRSFKGKVSCGGDGIEGVVVTDGVTCVKTNKSGEYLIPSFQKSGFVYISTPSTYTTDVKNGTIPQFYKAINSDTDIYDFEIKRNPKDDSKHTFFVQADVQVSTEKNLTVSYQKIVNDCKDLIKEYSEKDVFGIDCGDIVGDAPALFPTYIDVVKSLDIPIYRSIGNHDMDYYGRSHETSYQTFSNYFGPTHYSFNKGKAHYIVINNNFYIGRDHFYMGYVDEKTYQWLEQDLANIEDGSLLFFIMHIPARLTEKQEPFSYNYGPIADETVNASSLLEMLKPYNTHIITGHMHYNLNIIHAPNIMEHNTGAVCGTWWKGEICLDGTPQGYGVYEVDGDNLKWYYKSSGFPRDNQFRVYPVQSSKEYPNDIIANVWNWDKLWKVEWLEDGKVMGQMDNYTGYDPDAEILCSDKKRVEYDWISVIANKHMFKATPKKPNSKIEVRVTDRFGQVYTKAITK